MNMALAGITTLLTGNTILPFSFRYQQYKFTNQKIAVHRLQMCRWTLWQQDYPRYGKPFPPKRQSTHRALKTLCTTNKSCQFSLGFGSI